MRYTCRERWERKCQDRYGVILHVRFDKDRPRKIIARSTWPWNSRPEGLVCLLASCSIDPSVGKRKWKKKKKRKRCLVKFDYKVTASIGITFTKTTVEHDRIRRNLTFRSEVSRSGSISRQLFTSICSTPRRRILTHPVQTADRREDQNDLLYIAGHIEECEQEDSSNRSISRVQQPRNMAAVKKEVEVNSRFFYAIWSRALAFKGSFTSLAHAYSLFTLHVRVVLRATISFHCHFLLCNAGMVIAAVPSFSSYLFSFSLLSGFLSGPSDERRVCTIECFE